VGRRGTRHPFLRAGLAAGLLVAACRAPGGAATSAPEIRVEWTVAPSPPVTGLARVTLRLTDTRAGRPVEGAAVKVEGDMSHPGMVPVFATVREPTPGEYEAAMELNMAGDWTLTVDARLRDGRTLHRELALRGVRAP
jgi:hypothetical protein